MCVFLLHKTPYNFLIRMIIRKHKMVLLIAAMTCFSFILHSQEGKHKFIILQNTIGVKYYSCNFSLENKKYQCRIFDSNNNNDLFEKGIDNIAIAELEESGEQVRLSSSTLNSFESYINLYGKTYRINIDTLRKEIEIRAVSIPKTDTIVQIYLDYSIKNIPLHFKNENRFLSEILSKYGKNKNLLVTWASWCGSCIKNHEYYKQFLTLKSSTIFFLVHKKEQEKLSKYLAEYNIRAKVIIVNEDDENELNFSGYPSIKLIDRKGIFIIQEDFLLTIMDVLDYYYSK